MQKKKYENRIRELMKQQKLGVMATDMDGIPYTTLIAFANTDDLRHIFFATLKDTRKFSNISKNPKVTVLIDNRKNKPTDFYDAIAVTAEGHVKIREKEDNKIKEIFISKHPYLDDFVNSPNCALLDINIEKYHYVSRFQNVKILVLED
jgi:general stress protein 26